MSPRDAWAGVAQAVVHMQESSPFDQVFLGCTPLVDRDFEVTGLRISVFPVSPEAKPDLPALVEGLEASVPVRPASAGAQALPVLLNYGSGPLLDAALSRPMASRLVLEVPSFLAAEEGRTAAIARLRERGQVLAGSGRTLAALPPAVLKSFGCLVADASDEEFGLARPPTSARREVAVMLEGVRTAADAERAFAVGARGIVGWPLQEPLDAKTSAVPPGLKSVVELMDLVERQESLDAMERVLKADPSLAFRLLRLINSAAFGLRVEVTSFRHALMLLGHMRLKRWLSLLLVSASGDKVLRPLVYLAVRRAFLMEKLARALGEDEARDEMFICGLFSLLDQLMRQPMTSLMEQVPMPARVQVSLLGASGPYAPHLALMTAIEQASMVDIREGAQRLAVTPAALCGATLAAVSAVDELGV